MKKYRLDLKYCGKDFSGWQSQADGSAIQDIIESIFIKVLGEKLRLTGASRTDSGVHAEHQVATFEASKELDVFKLLNSLNALLPRSIGVTSLKEVAEDFHPIVAVKAKAYRYRLWLSRTRDPFKDSFVHIVPDHLDIEGMIEASKFLIGKHNFKAFCAADSSAKTYDRTIFEIAFSDEKPEIDIWFLGEGFLKQMLRTIVGTLIEVGMEKIEPELIIDILKSQDRTKAGPTAPAQGLCLYKIFYEEVEPLEKIIPSGSVLDIVRYHLSS